jgi:hypothetical protein
MDLAAHQPELMVRVAVTRWKPRVAKAVQNIPEQGGKPGAVHPVTTEPSIGSKGGIGVVIHQSENGRNDQHFIHRIETTNQNSKVNHDDSKR